MFEDYWSIISALIVFFLGLFLIINLSKYFKLKKSQGILIYVWHTIFCLAYLFYVQTFGGDSLAYYKIARSGNFELNFGTSAVYGISSLLAQGLNFGILSCFLVFNIFGAIGLLAFDGAMKHATKNKSASLRRLGTLIVFLPSVSFWSSGLGKDAISFLAMGLALWAALQLNKRILLMTVAIFLMLVVRPHIAGMMVIGLAVSVVFDKNANIIRRLLLSILAIVGTAIMVPFALDYAGVSDSGGVDGLVNYVEDRQSYNMEGGGGVDIANMSLPMQLFTYMFRPVIFEARSITSLAAGIDNLILLYLFIMGLYALISKKPKSFDENRKFMWVYVILAWIVLAMTSANLGIAVRQKWMFAPILIFLLISLVGKDRKPVNAANNPNLRLYPIARSK